MDDESRVQHADFVLHSADEEDDGGSSSSSIARRTAGMQNLSRDELLVSLAECQVDKEFVLSLWREFQSSAPDQTKLLGLVATREKEKASHKLLRMAEEVKQFKQEMAEMTQVIAVQRQELEAFQAREDNLKHKLVATSQQHASSLRNLSGHRATTDDIQPQLDSANNQITVLRNQLSKSTTHSDLMAAQIQDYIKSSKQQSNMIDKQKEAIDMLSEEIKVAKKVRTAAEVHSERMVSKAVSKLEHHEAASSGLREQLSKLSADHHHLQQEYAKLGGECKQLRNVLQVSSLSHAKEKERLKQTVLQQQQHTVREQKQRRKLRDKLTALQAQLADLQGQCSNVITAQSTAPVVVVVDTMPESTGDGDTKASVGGAACGGNESECEVTSIVNKLNPSASCRCVVSTATQTDHPAAGASVKSDLRDDEVSALRTVHARRLERFQRLIEDHRLLREQLKTYEDSDSARPPLNPNPAAPDLAGGGDTDVAWRLQQEDLHGPAPWNELHKAKKLSVDLQWTLDAACEQRDQLLVRCTELASNIQELRTAHSRERQRVVTHDVCTQCPLTQRPVDVATAEIDISSQSLEEASGLPGTVDQACQTASVPSVDTGACTSVCGVSAEQICASSECQFELQAKVESQSLEIINLTARLRDDETSLASLQATVRDLRGKLFVKQELDVLNNQGSVPLRSKSVSPPPRTPAPVQQGQTGTISAGAVIERGRPHKSSRCKAEARHCSYCCACGSRGRLTDNGESTVTRSHTRSKSLPPRTMGGPLPGQGSWTQAEWHDIHYAGKQSANQSTSYQYPAARNSVIAFGRRFYPACRHPDTPDTTAPAGVKRKRSKSLSSINARAQTAWRTASLKREVSVLRAAGGSLREQVASKSGEIEELQRQLVSSRAKLATSQATVKLLQDRQPEIKMSAGPFDPRALAGVHAVTLSNRLSHSTRGSDGHVQLVAALQQLKAKTEKEKYLTKDVTKQLATIRRLRTNNEAKSQELDRLQSCCTALERDVRQKKALLKSLRDNQIEAHRGTSAARTTMRQVQDQLKQKQEETTSLKYKVSAMQHRLTSQDQELKALQTKLQGSINEAKCLRKELQTVKTRAKEASQSAAECESVISSLTVERKQAEEAYCLSLFTMEKSIQSSKSQLEQYKQLVQLALHGKAVIAGVSQPEPSVSGESNPAFPDYINSKPNLRPSVNNSALKAAASHSPEPEQPAVGNASDESKARSTAWLKACQLSCSILELSATELNDLMQDT